jgi:ketosteroid isomerase-like protein
MSQENVDFVSGLFASGAGMDKDEMLAALPEVVRQICHPEIEWVEDPQRADGRTYRWHDGVLESWRQWLEQFDEWGFEVERMLDCGDEVLVVTREHGRGSASGAPVSATNYMVITVTDGKILRYQEFYDEQAALEAAGPRE